MEVDFSKYDYPSESQAKVKTGSGGNYNQEILNQHELTKNTFIEMNDALSGYVWVKLSLLTTYPNVFEDTKIDFTDAEKIRAAVLASSPDGRIDFETNDYESREMSVSEKEVEENCKNIFGTDAKWDMLQTLPENTPYDAYKFADSTGTYPMIIEALTEDENQMELQDYRIIEENGGYAGEIDIYWGYWGEYNKNPRLITHTLVYHIVPDDRSKYGFAITSLEIRLFNGKDSTTNSPDFDNTNSNSQNSTGGSLHQDIPFYGIWCSASKDMSDATKVVDKLRDSGFDARVYLTSDWSNLNSDPWYVVTAGVFSTESEAKSVLVDVKAIGYSDAYVKYSGDYIGH